MPTWIWICLYVVGMVATWPILWSFVESAEEEAHEHRHCARLDPIDLGFVALLVTMATAIWPLLLIVRILYVIFVARPKY